MSQRSHLHAPPPNCFPKRERSPENRIFCIGSAFSHTSDESKKLSLMMMIRGVCSSWLLGLTVLFSQTTTIFAQECFNSTFSLLVTQLLDPRPNNVRRTYSFCPDQVIRVGIPTDETFTSFVFGDYPLGIMRPNVTIEGNGVTFVGGLYQLVTLPIFQYQDFVFDDPTEGTIVKDIIFEGPLAEMDGFAADSVFLSGPGDVTLSNIVVQGLNFTDGQCGSNALTVGPSGLPGLETLTTPGSIQVTVKDSVFQDSKLSNCTSLMFTEEQSLTLRNVIVTNTDAWSALSTLGEAANVVLDNVCITNSTFTVASFGMHVFGNDTAFSDVSGLYLDSIEQEDCNATDNLYINAVEGDGLYECGSLETVDMCGVNPDAPTAMPTTMPVDMPTKMPSGPTEIDTQAPTDMPTDMPSAGYKMVGLPLVVYVSLGALVMWGASL